MDSYEVGLRYTVYFFFTRISKKQFLIFCLYREFDFSGSEIFKGVVRHVAKVSSIKHLHIFSL